MTGAAPLVLVVQHEAETGPGFFAGWLAGAGLRVQTIHPYDGQALPRQPGHGGYDGLVVLGGAMGPAEDEEHPWLPATRVLLADAVEVGLPTFGICLGAELLALGCGGRVRRGVAGPELGVLGIEVDAAAAGDPVFAALPAAPRVLQWHWEEISALPAGAVRLASSAAYPHQVFRLGAAAWGVQGHPEVTAGIAAAWAQAEGELLRSAGREPATVVAEVLAAEDELVATWRPVAERFAAVVSEYAARRTSSV